MTRLRATVPVALISGVIICMFYAHFQMDWFSSVGYRQIENCKSESPLETSGLSAKDAVDSGRLEVVRESNGRLEVVRESDVDTSTKNQLETDATSTRAQQAFPETCAPIKGYFNCCYPVTALASFPGSGNTWMRHLLEEATGYYTGSVYHDGSLKRSGFLGEGKRDGTVVAVKTHRIGIKTQEYDRVLLLTRSPFHSLVSEFNRRQGGGHMGYASKSAYSRGWSGFKKHGIYWKNFHQHWLSLKVPVYVIQYESLKTNLREELSKILSFLGLPISEERLDCVLHNSEGPFHRQQTHDHYYPFTEDNIKLLNDWIKEMEQKRVARLDRA